MPSVTVGRPSVAIGSPPVPDAPPANAYPKVFWNPIVPDEKFRVGADVSPFAFANGRFVAVDENQEQAVRAALRGYGPDKADRWTGEDRRSEWACRHCAFRTFNSDAQDDHERSNRH